mmetsp:Transcript_6271/g.8750  ORF Transcript_6271/g.8750 Transcript_6271/m.8750 type:complete len:699 (+) Transcript_6271:561-2657(+)
MLLKFSSSLLLFLHEDIHQEEIQRRFFIHAIHENQSIVTVEDMQRMLGDIQIGGYLEQKKIALGTLLLGLHLINYPKTQTKTGETSYENSSLLEKSSNVLARLMEPPKGMIIHGPAGCGKTRLMKSLVQLTGCDFIEMPNSILLSKFEGDAEKAVYAVFAAAQRRSPCCILIDNIDILCHSRSSATATDLQKRIVSCLLTLIDGFHSVADISQRKQHHVFFIGTTSRLSDVDPAIRRAGRLEKEIELSVPSHADREAILYRLCSDMKIDVLPSDAECVTASVSNESRVRIPSNLLNDAAAKSHGMVGADLLRLLKEAAYIMCKRIGYTLPSTSSANHPIGDSSVSINLEKEFESLTIGAAKSNNTEDKDESDSVIQSIPDSSSPLIITSQDVAAALSRTSPSALREVVIEVPTVRWTDIGGMDQVKQSLIEVVEWPLRRPEVFKSLGISPPRGVLLYGPPGCSKTLMAKALATESQMNFLAVRGPELLSKWLGESEKAIQSLFRKARAAAPSIIFFDEIDALAGKRGDSSSGVSDRVLSQLLTELDGIHGLKQVIVVAATNRPDLLDAALIRPGRIDRKIYVPPPDEESRLQIFTLELRKMPVHRDVNLSECVTLSTGFSGAEIAAVCSEAAMLAIEREADLAEDEVTDRKEINRMDKKEEEVSCVRMEDLREALHATQPQITAQMLAFYAELTKKLS